jgi:hypothetical protein
MANPLHYLLFASLFLVNPTSGQDSPSSTIRVIKANEFISSHRDGVLTITEHHLANYSPNSCPELVGAVGQDPSKLKQCMDGLNKLSDEVYTKDTVDSIAKRHDDMIGSARLDIQKLSDANDALTKRINELEARLQKLEHSK